jgi:hypothetical protein
VGRDVKLQWLVENVGEGAALASWSDGIYFSTDAILDSSDVLLQTLSINEPIGPGQTYARRDSVKMPAARPGIFFLILKANGSDGLVEQTASNNTMTIEVNVSIALEAIRKGDTVLLRWPAGCGNYRVRTAANISPFNSWAGTAFRTWLEGGYFWVDAGALENCGFFRLEEDPGILSAR